MKAKRSSEQSEAASSTLNAISPAKEPPVGALAGFGRGGVVAVAQAR